jgi:glycosyltransferase involved in cell wall biosynthesis
VARIAALAQEPVAHPWFDGRHDVVAAMGRLSPEKDFLSLIRAFAMVHRQHPTARLVILGTGDQETELVDEARALGIESVVHLLGFQQNPFAYLARSTCFVLSSVWEGFGMVIVEAMASGAAVLSTDCPYGPAEILEDGAYGLMTEPGSIEGLRDGMLRLIEDPQLRADLAQRGRARAMRFDIGAVVPQYADLMLEVDSRAHATRGARS